MSRSGLTAAYVSSSVNLIQPYVAAYMDFSGSAVRVWTGAYTKSLSDDFGGGNYLGVGTLGTISSITETTEVSAKGMDLTLSGIPTEYVSLALSNNYRGREVAVYLILFNTGMTSYEQITLFRGRMDQLIINESSETSTITVKCESRLIDLNRPSDIRYTDEAQKLLYPTDRGLEFVASMGDKSIYWGTSAPGSSANSPEAGGADGENPGLQS
jgi:hypothetical protein